jgi:hypothetical protein
MLDEPAPQIARIAAHLGLDAGQDVVNSVAERSSFQSMKNDKSCVGQVGFPVACFFVSFTHPSFPPNMVGWFPAYSEGRSRGLAGRFYSEAERSFR